MINVTFHNDDQGDLFIKVWDLNLPPDAQGQPVLVQDQVRLNQDATMNVALQEDGDGHVHYRWWAQRTDDPSKVAQHDDDKNPEDVTTFFG
jgi:hypothetical protein